MEMKVGVVAFQARSPRDQSAIPPQTITNLELRIANFEFERLSIDTLRIRNVETEEEFD
jgi:hypothetical protein